MPLIEFTCVAPWVPLTSPPSEPEKPVPPLEATSIQAVPLSYWIFCKVVSDENSAGRFGPWVFRAGGAGRKACGVKCVQHEFGFAVVILLQSSAGMCRPLRERSRRNSLFRRHRS